MNTILVLAKDIDPSKLGYSTIKPLDNGSKTVYINYDGRKLTIQTPKMHVPYGVGEGYKGKDGKDKVPDDRPKSYDMNLSFRGMDENPKIRVFHDKMKLLEAAIIQAIYENRLPWLRDEDLDVKTITKIFTSIIKLDKDKDTGKIVGRYPPTMRIKLPYHNDAFAFECTDMDKNEIDLKADMSRVKGAYGQFLIQLGGIWIAGGKCGVTWKVVKAKLEMPSATSHDFLEDSDDDVPTRKKGASMSDDDDLMEDALAAAVTTKAAVKPKAAPVVADSDEEEDEEEEDVPPPPPTKAGKKKAVPEPEPEPESEHDSDLDEPSPPPPPKKATVKKVVKK